MKKPILEKAVFSNLTAPQLPDGTAKHKLAAEWIINYSYILFI